MVNNYCVGDLVEIKNTILELIEINTFESGDKKYVFRCNKCGGITKNSIYKDYKNSICVSCSKNTFKYNEGQNFWIGMTQQGYEFWFDGSDEIVEYIKLQTWRRTVHGYFQNSKGEKLHRVVMGVQKDDDVIVSNKNGNKYDNRTKSLILSDNIGISRNKKISSKNSSGIIGLIKRGKRTIKYVGSVRVDGIDIYTPYKEKDEAIIDLLILQKHFGFNHNKNLFHLLDDVPESRFNEIEDLISRRMNAQNCHSIKSGNRYELSECGNYYNVFDKNNRAFKINKEHFDLVNSGIWYVTSKDSEIDKLYVQGSIIKDGKRLYIRLHRYLMGLLDKKYKKWFVDHLNGDGTDNRISNLCITNNKGNGVNKKIEDLKGYVFRDGKYRARIVTNGKSKSKTFECEQDARAWYLNEFSKSMMNRIEFKNKSELDDYIRDYNK